MKTQDEIIKEIDVIKNLMIYWFSNQKDIKLKEKVKTLHKIGLSITKISEIINKPIAIVKAMVRG